MTTQFNHWYIVAAIAIALTACAKGFQENKIKYTTAPTTGPGSPVAPLNPTTANTTNQAAVSPLVEAAAEVSPEIKTLISNPANAGKYKVEGVAGFALVNLKSSGYSGQESVLYINLKVSMGSTVHETLLVSNQAQMLVSAHSHVTINGHWTLPRGQGKLPIYITLNSTVNVVDLTQFRLAGTLLANYDNSDYAETLTQFDVPLCQVIVDPSFLTEYYDMLSTPGC